MPDSTHTDSAHPPRARVLIAAAALAAATTLAACGSSSPTSTATPALTAGGSSSASATLAFSKCMRANGVPNFPDLNGHGMEIGANGQTISVNGVTVNAPAFVTARQKCERYMPHTQATQAQSAQQAQRGIQFSRCMRRHGVPNFPDPQVVSGTGGGNHVAILRGVNIQAPAVQTAAKACGGLAPKGP